MKLLTEKEIKEISEAYIEKRGLLNLPNESLHDTVREEGYFDGYSQAQQDILESTSEGFSEYVELARGRDAFNPCDNDWTINEAEEAWQACSLSHAKKMQEKDAEIKRLQKAVSDRNQYKLNQEGLDKEGLDKAHAIYEGQIQKLQHQLEIQTKRVENLKKSNEFYASRKLARSCQAIDQELEKELENL